MSISAFKIMSIILLFFSFLTLITFSYFSYEKQESKKTISFYLFQIFLVVSVILSLIDKGKNNNISLQDIICLITILFAVILTLLSKYNDWGTSVLIMSSIISLLGSLQLIVGTGSLNKNL